MQSRSLPENSGCQSQPPGRSHWRDSRYGITMQQHQKLHQLPALLGYCEGLPPALTMCCVSSWLADLQYLLTGNPGAGEVINDLYPKAPPHLKGTLSMEAAIREGGLLAINPPRARDRPRSAR